VSGFRSTSATVEQVRHAFTFGNIGFDFIALANGEADAVIYSPFGGASADLAPRLAGLWLDVFNTVTLPFYWGSFEPERGHPDTHRLLRTATWFADRGVAVKGHPLVWHTIAPAWLLDLEEDAVEAALRARITREVTDFGGVIRTWDAINEAVIMPVFDRQGERHHSPGPAPGSCRHGPPCLRDGPRRRSWIRLIINDFECPRRTRNCSRPAWMRNQDRRDRAPEPHAPRLLG